MTMTSASLTSNTAPSFGGFLPASLRKGVFGLIQGWAAYRTYVTLSQQTDAELAEQGLTRDAIPSAVLAQMRAEG